MPWVKISDTALEDSAFLRLSRGARLLHLEALGWSNRTMAEGHIPKAALPRLTDEPDAEAKVAELLAEGQWQVEDGGWLLLYMLADQQSREDVERQRELDRQRQKRWYWHSKGQHHLCSGRKCATPNGVSADVPQNPNAPNAKPNGPPTRPDPSSPNGEGKGRTESSPSPEDARTPSVEEQIQELEKLLVAEPNSPGAKVAARVLPQLRARREQLLNEEATQ